MPPEWGPGLDYQPWGLPYRWPKRCCLPTERARWDSVKPCPFTSRSRWTDSRGYKSWCIICTVIKEASSQCWEAMKASPDCTVRSSSFISRTSQHATCGQHEAPKCAHISIRAKNDKEIFIIRSKEDPHNSLVSVTSFAHINDDPEKWSLLCPERTIKCWTKPLETDRICP